MPFVPSSFLLPVVRPGAPSSVFAPAVWAKDLNVSTGSLQPKAHSSVLAQSLFDSLTYVPAYGHMSDLEHPSQHSLNACEEWCIANQCIFRPCHPGALG